MMRQHYKGALHWHDQHAAIGDSIATLAEGMEVVNTGPPVMDVCV